MWRSSRTVTVDMPPEPVECCRCDRGRKCHAGYGVWIIGYISFLPLSYSWFSTETLQSAIITIMILQQCWLLSQVYPSLQGHDGACCAAAAAARHSSLFNLGLKVNLLSKHTLCIINDRVNNLCWQTNTIKSVLTQFCVWAGVIIPLFFSDFEAQLTNIWLGHVWCFRAVLYVNYTLPAVIRLSQALGSCSLASAAVAMFPVISKSALWRAGLTQGV